MAAVPRTRRHRLLQEYNVVTWLLEIYYYYYIYGIASGCELQDTQATLSSYTLVAAVG